jgi:restriction endonuclease S subunit
MKLREVAKIISGHPFRTKIQHTEGGAYPVVQMKDVSGLGIDWENVTHTDIKSVKVERFVTASDTLFVARGERNRAVHMSAAPANTLCSPHFFIIRVHPMALNPLFLQWYINQQPAREYFQRNAQGSNVQSVSRDVLQSLEIPETSLKQQEKIAALVSTIYKHQDKLQKLIENDQRLMDSIVQSLI